MWNEEEYLQRALNAAMELGDDLIAAGTIGDYEMIIVNDASTDATARLLALQQATWCCTPMLTCHLILKKYIRQCV